MLKKRILWADSLKGWLMILVIVGHAIQALMGDDCENNHVWNFICSFHMPAFMAVSGWFALKTSGRGFWSCKRRCYQVLVPYFVWSSLQWLESGCVLANIPLMITNPDSYFWFLCVVHLMIIGYLKEFLFILAPNCPTWGAITLLSILTFILSVIMVELMNKNKWFARFLLGKL